MAGYWSQAPRIALCESGISLPKKAIAILYGHTEAVLDVIYLPFADRKLVNFGSPDGTVRIWDYGFEKEMTEFMMTLIRTGVSNEGCHFSRSMVYWQLPPEARMRYLTDRFKFGKCPLPPR